MPKKTKPPEDEDGDSDFQDIATTLQHIADALDGSGMTVTRMEIDVPGRSHDPQRAERVKELLLTCPNVRVISNYAGRISKITMDWPE